MSVKIISKWKLPNVEMAKNPFLARISNKIRNLAMEKAPYDTGNLRRDIGTRVYSDYARVGTTKSTPYAKRLEYGTSRWAIKVKWHYKKIRWKIAYIRPYLVKNQKPRPYLIPAGQQIANEFPQILIAELDKTTK